MDTDAQSPIKYNFLVPLQYLISFFCSDKYRCVEVEKKPLVSSSNCYLYASWLYGIIDFAMHTNMRIIVTYMLAQCLQRKGRAGRVQPGECYHLYPKCVYEAFSEYQLPELLRTPLNSLCLQIKSLQVESIGEFLSAALQAPEPRTVSTIAL